LRSSDENKANTALLNSNAKATAQQKTLRAIENSSWVREQQSVSQSFSSSERQTDNANLAILAQLVQDE